MEKFEQLKQVIANIEPDFEKFYGKGVKAASPRIRKAMANCPTVEVTSYSGMTVDLCHQIGAQVIVRRFRCLE